MLHDCSARNSSLQFTVEQLSNKKPRCLDRAVSRDENIWRFTVYSKPTATDMNTANVSCHPMEFTLAGLQYLTLKSPN